jgi:hypothetical protein
MWLSRPCSHPVADHSTHHCPPPRRRPVGPSSSSPNARHNPPFAPPPCLCFCMSDRHTPATRIVFACPFPSSCVLCPPEMWPLSPSSRPLWRTTLLEPSTPFGTRVPNPEYDGRAQQPPSLCFPTVSVYATEHPHRAPLVSPPPIKRPHRPVLPAERDGEILCLTFPVETNHPPSHVPFLCGHLLFFCLKFWAPYFRRHFTALTYRTAQVSPETPTRGSGSPPPAGMRPPGRPSAAGHPGTPLCCKTEGVSPMFRTSSGTHRLPSQPYDP